MGARRAPVLQACEELRDLPRRRDVPPRAARAAHRHLGRRSLGIPELSVVAANLHWGYGYRRAGTRQQRIDLDAVFARFDADVLMLPESFEPDGRPGVTDLLTTRGYTVASVPYRRFPSGPGDSGEKPKDPGTWHLALASRHPLLRWRAVPIGSVTRDPVGPRFAIHGEIDVDGTQVHVVSLHTSSKLWYFGPARHMLGLRRNLGRLEGPAVIAGDFNFWGPGVSALMRGWHRTVLGRTWPADRPHSQIDHILVNDAVGVLDSEVLAEYGSDHRPVRARLEV